MTRFCQKIGVKGFPEFKLKLIQELRNGLMEEGDITAAVTMSERENAVTMARKVQQVQAQAAEETQRELSYSQLVRVGRMIAEARAVDFYVIVISSVRDGIVSRQADEFCVILTDKPEKAGGFSVCFPIL